MNNEAVLVLENGLIFTGVSVGAKGFVCGEIVFNTATTGYQEILTDPSYSGQIITFTYPHIGNVGINKEDAESNRICASGAVMRQCSSYASSWRSEKSLTEYFKEQNSVVISDVDTRHLTKCLRDSGVMIGCIMTDIINTEFAFQKIKDCKSGTGQHLLKNIVKNSPCTWPKEYIENQEDFHVVVYDFGVKLSILRCLRSYGCRITVVPSDTSIEEIVRLVPEGIVLSNGPGNPEIEVNIIENVRKLLLLNFPIFGICLGHQLLALACGAKTKKMKFGHHGANHPVQDMVSKQVIITSQNHGFEVDEKNFPSNLFITHRSLFDNSIQGVSCKGRKAYGFQGHPEGGPGPEDGKKLFIPFIRAMKIKRKKMQKSKMDELYAKAE